MIRFIIILVLVIQPVFSFGCSCGQSLGSYFLNQAKNFDAIVEGKFYRDGNYGKGYIVIDKIYKGNISKDTLDIAEGFTDCTQVFIEDSGVTLILGLQKSKYKSEPDTYSAPSCITSVLVVDERQVKSKINFYNIPIRHPRIGLFSTEMRKERFVKKMKNKYQRVQNL